MTLWKRFFPNSVKASSAAFSSWPFLQYEWTMVAESPPIRRPDDPRAIAAIAPAGKQLRLDGHAHAGPDERDDSSMLQLEVNAWGMGGIAVASAEEFGNWHTGKRNPEGSQKLAGG